MVLITSYSLYFLWFMGFCNAAYNCKAPDCRVLNAHGFWWNITPTIIFGFCLKIHGKTLKSNGWEKHVSHHLMTITGDTWFWICPLYTRLCFPTNRPADLATFFDFDDHGLGQLYRVKLWLGSDALQCLGAHKCTDQQQRNSINQNEIRNQMQLMMWWLWQIGNSIFLHH